MRPAGVALLGVLLCGALVGCSDDAPDVSAATTGSSSSGAVPVGAPGLAALRERAGIDSCPATDTSAPVPGDGLPFVSLPCLGGGRDVDLAHLRRVPTVINLWATWGPCREELPLIQQLHERGRVRVLGVDFADDDPAAALRLAAASGVTYALVADPDAQLRTPLQVSGLPVTIFVAADGRVVHTEIGPLASYDELSGLVREHLGVAA